MEAKTSYPDFLLGKGAAHLLQVAEESDESEEIVFQNEETGFKHRINYQASSPDEVRKDGYSGTTIKNSPPHSKNLSALDEMAGPNVSFIYEVPPYQTLSPDE